MSESDLVRTRRALHAVAELVLAGPQYRASGTIRLAVTPGGFSTVDEPHLEVVGNLLSVGCLKTPIEGTARHLAASFGVEAGRPDGLYEDGAGLGIDDELILDASAAERIEDALALGAEALTMFAPDEQPVLWPEHFDVAIRVDDVNYGVSPGDDFLAEPYAYVGVHPVLDTDFWNAPFGAARPMTGFDDALDLARFFAAGRDERG